MRSKSDLGRILVEKISSISEIALEIRTYFKFESKEDVSLIERIIANLRDAYLHSQELMEIKKIAVIDIETTGLRPQYDLIIEIGIAELDLESGDTRIIFDSLVKETMFGEEHREAWIFDHSDLIFEEIENAPTLDSLIPSIQETFNKYQFTAFNKSFDLSESL